MLEPTLGPAIGGDDPVAGEERKDDLLSSGRIAEPDGTRQWAFEAAVGAWNRGTDSLEVCEPPAEPSEESDATRARVLEWRVKPHVSGPVLSVEACTASVDSTPTRAHDAAVAAR